MVAHPDAARQSPRPVLAGAAARATLRHKCCIASRRQGVRRTDVEAVGELAGEALAAGGGFIKEMHEGIASRPFGILGPAAAPVRAVHDGVSSAVYGGVRGALRTASRGGAGLLAQRRGDDR